ncbi:hypothetical protein E1264_02505 [Actinomadura sp. KC216]|uniref:hypothetical protein n=1 Tax=Actinomadura sp. KC216 TaxID=2530370 RepID=UPI0010437F9A|nr:hypothetical protein [Actinomadura sp. KC216]TDB91182.1 hypothetical protein E1264_02505 [Actinomadura sp. KC216]
MFTSTDARSLADDLTGNRESDRHLDCVYEHIRCDGATEKRLRDLVRLESSAADTEVTAYALGALRYSHAMSQPLSAMAYSAQRELPAIESSVGLSSTALPAPPWTKESTAYPGLLCWTALHGSQADFGMAIFADLHRYDHTTLRVAEAFAAAPAAIAGEIIEYHADETPDGLSEQVLDFVQEGLDKGDNAPRLSKSAASWTSASSITGNRCSPRRQKSGEMKLWRRRITTGQARASVGREWLDQYSTTRTACSPDREFVGQIEGEDAGYIGLAGAPRRLPWPRTIPPTAASGDEMTSRPTTAAVTTVPNGHAWTPPNATRSGWPEPLLPGWTGRDCARRGAGGGGPPRRLMGRDGRSTSSSGEEERT